MVKRYGMLVDMNYCLGCGICVISCKQENYLPPNADDRPGIRGISWNQVLSITEGVYPELSRFTFPSHCAHCANPPCVKACPKVAININIDSAVLISSAKCNACVDQPDGVKACISACPYGAIQFNPKKNVVESCTFCSHRLASDSNAEPACVRACTGRCLTFGDLNDPSSKISIKIREAGNRIFVLKPEKGTEPSVKYIRPSRLNLGKLADFTFTEVLYGYKKQPGI